MTRRRFGTIITIDSGHFRCKWTDAQGRQRTHHVHGSKHDAELYLAKVEMQRFGADAGVTYAAYWSNVVDPQIDTLQEKTKHEYRRLWGKHLAPAIGSRLVASTTYAFAQGVIDGIDAPSQQRKCAALWKKVCNMAVRDGVLTHNPVMRMSFKRLIRREKRILCRSEMIPFVESCEGSAYLHLVVLELLGGLRHGEACAVAPCDVSDDGDNVLVRVDKARVTVNGRMVEKDTKNLFSVRTVPFCGVCADALRRCDVRQTNPETATHNFRSWRKRRGLPHVPFGDMRSSFATVAGECSDGHLVDMFIGHSGTDTAARWYREPTKDGMLIVAKAFSDYLYSTRQQ